MSVVYSAQALGSSLSSKSYSDTSGGGTLHRLSFSNVSRSITGDCSRALRHSFERALLSSPTAIAAPPVARALTPLEVSSPPARGGAVEEEFFVESRALVVVGYPPSAFRFRWVVVRALSGVRGEVSVLGMESQTNAFYYDYVLEYVG